METIKQQWPLDITVEKVIIDKAERLGKRPNEFKREVLTKFSKVSEKNFYSALASIEKFSD